MLKLFDFTCDSCSNTWEDLVEDCTSTCPKCGTSALKDALSPGKLAVFSMRDAAGKKAVLMRRSVEHSVKELKREPEKFGSLGKERSRDGQIMSFGGLGKK